MSKNVYFWRWPKVQGPLCFKIVHPNKTVKHIFCRFCNRSPIFYNSATSKRELQFFLLHKHIVWGYGISAPWLNFGRFSMLPRCQGKIQHFFLSAVIFASKYLIFNMDRNITSLNCQNIQWSNIPNSSFE